MSEALPPLPPAKMHHAEWEDWEQYHDDRDPLPRRWSTRPLPDITDYFTADQMRAYAQQAASAAVLQERERAQNVCLAQYDRNKQSMEVGGMSDNYMTGYHDATGDCAAAIRTAPKESA